VDVTLRLPPVIGKGLEAAATGALGVALALLVGGLLPSWVAISMAVVAGINGVLSGWRQIYPWLSRRGLLAFALDSTWASAPVAVGLLAHVVAAWSKGGYEASLSRRQGQHVYRRGAHLKPGFAFTVGNVISSAGDLSRARRRKLITDHEAVHVWQARWFGPAYLVLYLLWSAGGALGGVVLWWRRGRTEPLGRMVESCSYYLNPFEWWAYSRDDLWPPPGLLVGVGWRKPAVRPLADVRVRRHIEVD
jgi:hypothetical protein